MAPKEPYNQEHGEDALSNIVSALTTLKNGRASWEDAEDERLQYVEVINRFISWAESMQYEGLEMWSLDWESIKEELL